MLKRFILFILIAAALVLPCSAAGDVEPPLLDSDELDALMAPFIEKYGLTERNFGLGFLYTGSNESYYINGDSAKYAASVFKVPLCMLVAEKVSSGELQQEDTFAELAISTIEERCIIASNNTIAYSVYSALQPDTPELLTKYSGVEAESLPTEYRRQYYTPRMIVNTLHTLYEDPERFPNIIECMLQAQPNNYFRQTLEGRWDVAQKYGQYASVLNNAGIIYTPTPIILVVMTDRLHGNMELIGELAEVFSEYALTLDERAAEREEAQLAQEEAARRAEDEARRAAETERQRLEAEKAAQAEAERLAAEAAARAEAEQLAAARLESRARRLRIAAVSGTGLLPALGFMLYRKRK